MNFATLFSGGEGAGVGLRAAGLHHVWGIEYDAAIAAAAQANGFDVRVADVRSVDYAALPRVDWLHASPVCTRASVANANATEAQEDIDTAAAVVRALQAQQPQVFTLENVWQYRTFKAFTNITDALGRLGYFWTYDHVNAADFGGEIKCPLHALGCTNDFALIAGQPFKARSLPKGIAPDIAQIIAMMLPADQAKHLAWDAVVHLVRAIQQDIAASVAFHESVKGLAANEVLTTTHGREVFILMNADMFASASMGNIDANIAWLLNLCLDAPLLQEKWCITSMETRRITIRLILSCFLTTVSTFRSITRNRTDTIPTGASVTSGMASECPLCHVSAVPQTRRRLILRASRGLLPHLPASVPRVGWYAAIEDLIPTLPESALAPWQLARLPEELRGAVLVGTKVTDNRAVLVDTANAGRDASVMASGSPAMTVQAWHGRRPSQAPLLVAGLLNSDSTTLTARAGGQPSFTVTTQGNQRDARAYPGARVVAMTPRALARFQSVPDSYELPTKRALAAKVIGNMVPPLLMQRIAEGMLEVQP